MFEMTYALLVADHEQYAHYRAEIAPLLEKAGGRFRYDFEVARTLKGEAEHEINRLFVLQFPDRAAKEHFFTDPQYREIRARRYEKAVQRSTLVAKYDSQAPQRG